MTKNEYRRCLQEELEGCSMIKVHMKHYEKRAVYLIRAMQYYFNIYSNCAPLNMIFKRYSMYCRGKLITEYAIFVEPNCEIGIGLKLPHPNGIIIGRKAVIGKNVTIYQQVTIGAKEEGGGYPTILDGCILYSGSKVFGDILVSKGTILGANAVLNKSTDEYSVYCGVPAKKIK